MKISTLKETVRLCGDANVTCWIWGHRGLGKSSVVKQVAVEQGWGFIDLRCSQLEASDIRGLPARGEDGRTHFLPPADMPVGDLTIDQLKERLGEVPDYSDTSDAGLEAARVYDETLNNLQPHFQRGILFLDEANRAQDDVLQAIFQLVLDRKVGQYTLPPGWRIVVAGNYSEGYQVNGFNDPAFINRFCHLILSGGDATLEEWINYIAGKHETDATEVIEFASQNVKHLDGEVAGELGFSIQPSRRSWEAVINICKAARDGGYSEGARIEALAGLIGRELAQSFSRYSCPVKPRMLLDRGVKAMSSELTKLNRGQMTGLMWGMVSFCKHRIEEDKVATVVLDFADWMVNHMKDQDIVVAFCRAMVSSGNPNDNQEKARAAVISNPRLAQMIAKFNKRSNNKTGFIDRLNERPALQKALSRVSWGSDGSDDRPAKADK